MHFACTARGCPVLACAEGSLHHAKDKCAGDREGSQVHAPVNDIVPCCQCSQIIHSQDRQQAACYPCRSTQQSSVARRRAREKVENPDGLRRQRPDQGEVQTRTSWRRSHRGPPVAAAAGTVQPVAGRSTLRDGALEQAGRPANVHAWLLVLLATWQAIGGAERWCCQLRPHLMHGSGRHASVLGCAPAHVSTARSRGTVALHNMGRSHIASLAHTSCCGSSRTLTQVCPLRPLTPQQSAAHMRASCMQGCRAHRPGTGAWAQPGGHDRPAGAVCAEAHFRGGGGEALALIRGPPAAVP